MIALIPAYLCCALVRAVVSVRPGQTVAVAVRRSRYPLPSLVTLSPKSMRLSFTRRPYPVSHVSHGGRACNWHVATCMVSRGCQACCTLIATGQDDD